MFLTIIIVLFVLSGSYLLAHRYRNGVLPAPATKGLTPQSKHLYHKYMALPVESRPFPDVVSILKGMDERHSADADKFRNHFNENFLPPIKQYIGSYKFRWSANGSNYCTHKSCEFKDYGAICAAIEAVQQSVDDRERAILAAKTAGAGDMAQELIAALRSEASIQNQVTKELLS